MLTKDSALDCLQSQPRASVAADYDHIFPLAGDDQVAAILLPYDGNVKERRVLSMSNGPYE